jgi:hypothetical protein
MPTGMAGEHLGEGFLACGWGMAHKGKKASSMESIIVESSSFTVSVLSIRQHCVGT